MTARPSFWSSLRSEPTDADQLEHFTSIADKYREWKSISQKEKIGSGERKVLGRIGNEKWEVFFITPDQLRIEGVTLSESDIILVEELISAVPLMKQTITAALEESLRKKAILNAKESAEKQRSAIEKEKVDKFLR